VIDSVALVWGGRTGSSSRRADAPKAGRRREVVSEPIRLDWDQLIERLGSDDGQVREIHYAHGKKWKGGHWPVGHAIDLMYRDGRLEVRASLPKLIAGRNDVVLNERGVHVALRELASRAGDAIGHPLSLREAVPTRLDYCFQWPVPSVAAVLTHLKQTFKPPRKVQEDIVSPRGGRTLWYGPRSKYGLRFYDKVGELVASGVEPDVEIADWETVAPLIEHGSEHSSRQLDRLLRYEIQDRRSKGELRLIHERGYRAGDIRAEMTRPIAGLLEIWTHDLDGLIDRRGGNRAIANVLASLHLAEHEELLPLIRNRVHRNVYDRWRRRAKDAALAIHAWQPVIPETAFRSVGSESLWRDDDLFDEVAA
jgi:hypothetical protein